MKRKIYENKKEKVTDFLIGFILLPIALFIISNLIYVLMRNTIYGQMIFQFGPALVLVGIIYVCLMRKYIALGLLLVLILVPLIALGSCWLSFFGPSFFSQLF